MYIRINCLGVESLISHKMLINLQMQTPYPLVWSPHIHLTAWSKSSIPVLYTGIKEIFQFKSSIPVLYTGLKKYSGFIYRFKSSTPIDLRCNPWLCIVVVWRLPKAPSICLSTWPRRSASFVIQPRGCKEGWLAPYIFHLYPLLLCIMRVQQRFFN